jgi:hypothetical protein
VPHSIERQSRFILIITHALEIVPGINVSCPAKEELVEGRESARTQRINEASEGDFYEKTPSARNRYKLKVAWE